MGATQKSWRIYFQFVVPPLGGLSWNQWLKFGEKLIQFIEHFWANCLFFCILLKPPKGGTTNWALAIYKLYL